MQLSAFYVGSLFLLCIGRIAAAGRYFPYVTFNNDIEEKGKSCLPEEWTLISDTVNKKRIGQRNLGRKSQCYFSRKYGWDEWALRSGRRLVEIVPQAPATMGNQAAKGLRGLGSSAFYGYDQEQCDIDTDRVNATLIALLPRLSESCQALVTSPMEVSCMKKVKCDISHLTLWNTKTGVAIAEEIPPSGGVYCNNAIISIEAVTNFDIGRVNMAWTGPMWRGSVLSDKMDQFNSPFNITEPVSPYFMFGKHKNGPYGMRLPPGNFTLTATSSKDTAKAKTISFTMKWCGPMQDNHTMQQNITMQYNNTL
jgi:hypothetical protein